MTQKTWQDLVAEAKQEIEEVDAEGAQRRLADGAVAVDVREADELERGFVPNAVHIPRGMLEINATGNPATADRDTPIVLYCGFGGRSALAAQALARLGYTNVVSLAGGYTAWVEAGQPVQLPRGESLDDNE